MQRFITKALFFFLLYLGISALIRTLLPYHWGNPRYSVKISYLENQKPGTYNTYFFGSSKVYRHIDPQVFDSITNLHTGEKIRSFNLGSPSTFAPQTYYLYEHFLDSELAEGVKYCFLELTGIKQLKEHMLHREKTNYWIGLGELNYLYRALDADLTLSTRTRGIQKKFYLSSFVENVLHLGHFISYLINKNHYDPTYLGPVSNGFLDKDYEYACATDPVLKRVLGQLHQEVRKDSSKIQRQRAQITKALHEPENDFFNELNWRKLMELQEKSRQQGIALYFLFSSPRPKQDYAKVINLRKALPDTFVIDIADPIIYPALYYAENYFDPVHFNAQGARLASTYFAQEFAKKIE